MALISFGLPSYNKTTDSTILKKIFVGGRFLAGNSNTRFSIDIGYNLDLAKTSSYNNKTLITDCGVEFKIDDGIFLEIAGGFKGNPVNFFKNSNILALGSLKYAIHPKSRFNLPE